MSLTNPAVSAGISDELRTQRAPLSLVQRLVRFGFHLFLLYSVVSFACRTLPDWMTSHTLAVIFHAAVGTDPFGLLFSHLLAFSAIPAFLAGVVINAKLMHGVARFTWIAPTALFVLAFLFKAPGIYPTMLWQSDFGLALHHFFGAIPLEGLAGARGNFANWIGFFQAYSQLRFTAPLYAGIAYSVGAALGMSAWCRALQRLLEKL